MKKRRKKLYSQNIYKMFLLNVVSSTPDKFKKLSVKYPITT